MRALLSDFRDVLLQTLASGFFCGAMVFCCYLGYQLAASIVGRL